MDNQLDDLTNRLQMIVAGVFTDTEGTVADCQTKSW